VAGDVPQQLSRLPADASHLVISTGGNDALEQMPILRESARSVAEVLQELATIQEGFERDYRRMLDAVLRRGLPTVICTIYNGNFPEADVQRMAGVGLALFDDVILRQAFAAELPVIDLRLVFSQPGDYANEIEPSAVGGERIARAIAGVVATHDFTSRRTTLYW
jgi:hypothetical protein